jgi:hypothetical protein
VTIPANTIAGPFPIRETKEELSSKRETPGYNDCAVYLAIYKQDGAGSKPEQPWRRIRIPVMGNATAR